MKKESKEKPVCMYCQGMGITVTKLFDFKTPKRFKEKVEPCPICQHEKKS